MANVLSYSPGQTVTIVQEILNLDGYRSDGYVFGGSNGNPVIARIILPNLSLMDGYPATMNKLDVGLYNFSFILPTGAASVGTYIVDIYWYNPDTLFLQQTYQQILVNAPYGMYGTTIVG